MYKDKLEKWGFFKNCTATRVSGLLHQKTVRDAVGKVSTFGSDKKGLDIQKIEKYLKRKKKNLRDFIETEDERRVGPDTISTTPSRYGSDINLSPTNSQSTENGYEHNCPYRPWKKKFRLIENFPR
jgi:hypothetical protein